MRKTVLLLCSLLATVSLLAAPVAAKAKNKATATSGISAPRVDPGVELLSILARLAGYDEYQYSNSQAYADSVDAWFAPYKAHPAVEYLKKMREETDLGYNALPIMGAYLTAPPKLRARLPLTAEQPEFRWGVEHGKAFIPLARRFYKETRCGDFFARHDARFRKAESGFGAIFDELDTEWFGRFFGEGSQGGMVPVIGMLFGPCNYGGDITYPDSTVDQYAFMGTWSAQSDGTPRFDHGGFMNTLVHEFNHSYVNPALESDPQLVEASEALFKAEEQSMRSQAYTKSSYVLNETFVRAAVIRYLLAHGDSTAAAADIREQVNRHFIWMPEAVALLGEYESQRDRYPDFHSFVPRVLAFCRETGAGIDTIRARRAGENQELRAKALHATVESFENGAQDVDPGLTEITIRFDRPLVGRGYSFGYGPGGDKKFISMTGFKGYSSDKTALTLEVKLEPGRDYEFTLLKAYSFATPDGLRLYEDYLVSFRTREK